MQRRDFLKAASGAVLGPTLLRGTDTGKRSRLACNSWPFRAYFDTPQMHHYRDSKYPLIAQWEFPEFLADHFGIHNVEFLPQHFPDLQATTIDRVKAGLAKAKSTCCNLMGVELPGGIYNPKANRPALVQDMQRWIEVANALDCSSITVVLNGSEKPDAHVAATNLGPVVDLAHQRGKKILFHNDDIQRESAEILSAVVQQLGRDRTGTCPDFGNFATRSAAYALAQLRLLAPYASQICHAKDGIADGAVYSRDDFPGSMRVMREAGFHGIYSLEFEGLGEPIEGVRSLMKLTEAQLA